METSNIPEVDELAKDIPINEAVNIWGGLDNERVNILYRAMKQIKTNFDEIIAGNQVYVKNKIYETDPGVPLPSATYTITTEEYLQSRNLKVTWNGLEMTPNVDYTKPTNTTVVFSFLIQPDDYLVIDEYPDTYAITTLLLSRESTRYGIQREFAIYPFDISRDLCVIWNGVKLIKDMDYEVLSTSTIGILFDVEIEDTLWIYIENVY